MADENKSLTAVQWVALVIALLAIGGIIWAAVASGGDIVRDDEKLYSFIKLSVAIAAIAIVFIVVFYLVSGANTTEASKSFRLEFIEKLTNVTSMQWVASVIGLFTIGGMVWVIASGGDLLRDGERTRGLITFSVAIVTVAIALILVFFLVFGVFGNNKEEFTSRFTFGKDILMVFVGILGTIMGFYYGTDKVSPDDIKTIQQSGPNSGASATTGAETKAFELLLKQDYDGAVKAFDDAYKATPISPNIKNIGDIRTLLTNSKDALTIAGDKKAIWQTIYCDISTNKRAVGQSKELNDKFDIGCKATPTPIPSPT